MEEDYKQRYENLIENLKRAKETKGGYTFKSVVDEFVPELKGDDEDKVVEAILYAIGNSTHADGILSNGVTRIDAIAWIKKQCIDISSFPEEQQTFMKNYASLDKITLIKLLAERDAEIIESVEKQCDQSDEKVEPKFKAGDWVVANNGESGVFRVEEDGWPDSVIRISGSLGNQFIATCTLNKQYHHWTIQDAKDGDVLYTPKGRGVECIFIVDNWKEIRGTGKTLCSKIAYRVEDDEIISGGLGAIWWEGVVDAYYPATREQHNLLFSKIKEAGYEWDAEKKELKKIQTKLAWSEEGEDYLTDVKTAVHHYFDEGYAEELCNRLKSLKERCYWKPSDEQMEALYTYIYNPQYFNSPDPRMELVESVYNDLKKLKGE